MGGWVIVSDQTEELGNGYSQNLIAMRPTLLEELESLVVMATNFKRAQMVIHTRANHPGH